MGEKYVIGPFRWAKWESLQTHSHTDMRITSLKFKSIQGEVRCVKGELCKSSHHFLVVTSSRNADTQPNSYQHTQQLWVVVRNGGVKVCVMSVYKCVGLCVCACVVCCVYVCTSATHLQDTKCYSNSATNNSKFKDFILSTSYTGLQCTWETFRENRCKKDRYKQCNERKRRSVRRTSFQASCATSP